MTDAAAALRKLRNSLRAKHNLSFRELYRSLELPGEHPLKEAHAALDEAVGAAYGMTKGTDPLAFLLALNQEAAEREADGAAVAGSGAARVCLGSKIVHYNRLYNYLICHASPCTVVPLAWTLRSN